MNEINDEVGAKFNEDKIREERLLGVVRIKQLRL